MRGGSDARSGSHARGDAGCRLGMSGSGRHAADGKPRRAPGPPLGDVPDAGAQPPDWRIT